MWLLSLTDRIVLVAKGVEMSNVGEYVTCKLCNGYGETQEVNYWKDGDYREHTTHYSKKCKRCCGEGIMIVAEVEHSFFSENKIVLVKNRKGETYHAL